MWISRNRKNRKRSLRKRCADKGGDGFDQEIEKKIRQYEKQKQIRLERKQKLEAEIEHINLHLKELYGVRKQYEKLEKECESVIFKNWKGIKMR